MHKNFLDEDLLADEDLNDLMNYYNNHQQHQDHGKNQGFPIFGDGAFSAPSSPFVSSPSNLNVTIETAIDESFRNQWSNYDLKKDDEMYEKYNVALKIQNNSNRETPPLFLNCRHEIHDKGSVCEISNKKTNVSGDYLDFLLLDGQHFTLAPHERRIILVSISRPSRTMVSHGKYYIQFFVLTSGDYQSLCQTQQIKVLTSKNKNNRTKKVSYDLTKQDTSVKNLVPKEWQSLQTSHQVFESCYWDDIGLTGEKKKSTSVATPASSKTQPSSSASTSGTPPQQPSPKEPSIQQQLLPISNNSPFESKNPFSPGLAGLSSPNDFLRGSPFRDDHHDHNHHNDFHPFLDEPQIQNYIPISTHISIIKIFQKQIDFYKNQLEVLLTELKRYDKRMAENLYRQYVNASVLKKEGSSTSPSPWDETNSLPSEEDLENMFNKMKIIKEQIEQSISDSKKPPCSPVAYTTPSTPTHPFQNSHDTYNYSMYNPRDYDFSFEDDVTIPDFCQVACNSTFLKTWKISNCGIPFPAGTVIVAKSDRETPLEYNEILLPLTNTDEKRVLTEQELPGYGETRNVSISIKAPNMEALWRREYCIQLPDGTEFGDSLVVIFKTVK